MSALALLALALLGLQALFTAAEVAIQQADGALLEGAGARRALELRGKPGVLRAACGLGQAAGAGGLGALASLGALSLGSPIPLVVAAPLALLCGKLGVGALARRHANALAPALSRPVGWLARPLGPLVRALARLAGARGDEVPTVTREQMVALLGSAGDGAVAPEDRGMIQRVFALSELTVRDVMVPLSAVDALPRETTVADAARRIVESGHSRLPVYKDRVDRVIGLVLHQDVLASEDWTGAVELIARPASYTPQNKRADQLLGDLRRDRQRLAVVVDEYGGAVGIVTVEDLLELIVGDIQDESDRPAGMVRPGTGPGEWHASGRAPLDELLRVTGLRLPEGDYESVAGFLLSVLGHVPRAGERVTVDGFALTVTRASERAVQEVSVRAVRQGPSPGLR